jgi:hypothetical protein
MEIAQNITEAIMGVSEELRYVTAERCIAHALDERYEAGRRRGFEEGKEYGEVPF